MPYPTLVIKSSIYLPEPLKRRLAAGAASTGVSEARFIRDAVTSALARGDDAPAARTADPAAAGRLVLVGVGPGAADLVTVRALRALRRADRVVAPCTSPDAIGRAEQIVREAAPDVVLERAVFVMRPDHQARAGALNAVCDRLARCLEAGEEVAFVTLGDPHVYSTASSIAAGVLARRPRTAIETVAGIMAFQAVAMAGRVMLADEQQSLVVLPAASPDEVLKAEMADPTRTVILYKGGGRVTEMADHLEAAGRLDGAVLGELMGMTGERVERGDGLRSRPGSYLSTVISPAGDGAGPVPA